MTDDRGSAVGEVTAPILRHNWDDICHVCIRCNITRRQWVEEYEPGCRKPRFGEGAPGGLGGVTTVGRK